MGSCAYRAPCSFERFLGEHERSNVEVSRDFGLVLLDHTCGIETVLSLQCEHVLMHAHALIYVRPFLYKNQGLLT